MRLCSVICHFTCAVLPWLTPGRQQSVTPAALCGQGDRPHVWQPGALSSACWSLCFLGNVLAHFVRSVLRTVITHTVASSSVPMKLRTYHSGMFLFYCVEAFLISCSSAFLFLLFSLVFEVKFTKTSLRPRFRSLAPMFSFMYFIISGLTFSLSSILSYFLCMM